MKQIPKFIMVCFLALAVCLPSGVWAISPPKQLCAVDSGSGSFLFALTCKLNGTVRIQDSVLKTYVLAGTMEIPLSGSGYVYAQKYFDAYVSGAWGSDWWYASARVDLSSNEGAYTICDPTGCDSGNLELVDCKTLLP